MSSNSSIEWTDATWNPTTGCSIVSPGCTNCYAMEVANGLERRFDSPKYRGLTKIVNGNGVWTGEVRLDEAALLQPLKWKKPRRIFVNSMSDLFHEKLTDEQIDRVFAVMALCPQHTFQVLTKRAERMREYLRGIQPLAGKPWDRITEIAMDIGHHVRGYRGSGGFVARPIPNVWLGVSCERQQEADERIPLLLQTPAAVRFISAEPLLGPISLKRIKVGDLGWQDVLEGWRNCKDYPGRENILDWVIVGGESGRNARPMHPDWARSLRDQCQAAGVAYFFKQWGEWGPVLDVDGSIRSEGRGSHGAIFHDLHHVTIFPRGERHGDVFRVGKKRAGRLLDGREWNEFPSIHLSSSSSDADSRHPSFESVSR